ncbi:MAG: PQQ-binding-like beta-propeller repeat protein [Pseudomonadota bacterium]
MKSRLLLGLAMTTLTLTTLTLAGCTKMFKKEKIPLEGDRELVLLNQDVLRPNPEAVAVPVQLPAAQANRDWDQNGGCASHCMPPLALSDQPKVVWTSSIGSSSGGSRRFLSTPIVHDGQLYVLNADQEVQAIDTTSGKQIWQQPIHPDEISSHVLGGGIAYDQGNIYVASAFAEVLALDAASGAVKWRTPINSPARSAPTIKDGHVFVTTINNEVEAFDQNTGQSLWSHSGITETAGLLGGASPAASAGIVVAPFSSGEIFALRPENGHPLWSESLASFKRVDSVSSLPHIRASPVIDQNLVFLVSHSGRTAALDVRTGSLVWDREIGGIQAPAVAGNFLFMVTTDSELVCLTRDRGLVQWVTQLPRYTDEEEGTGKIVWQGPLLVENRLIVTGSTQEMITVKAEDGKIVNQQRIPDSTSVPPIAAQGTLYLLTDGGDIVAMR